MAQGGIATDADFRKEDKARLSDEDLRAIVEQEIRQSLGYIDDELSDARTQSMDYYLGKPYGNEVEGRSKVVSTDVADTVDWILPSLLEIFTSGEEVVRFEPTEPNDEEYAAQATDFVNYVLTKDNNAFLILYQWFKDALLQKNGFVKAYWDTVSRQKTETYEGLPDIAFTAVMGDVQRGDVEIVKHSMMLDEMQQPRHWVTLRRARKYGCVRVDPVPPEEMLVDRNAKIGQPTRFIAHRSRQYVSDLLEMGYDADKVAAIPPYAEVERNSERLARDTVGESDRDWNETTRNKQMQSVWITEAYIRVDYDGDGIAELRKVVVGGDNGQVLLENEEADEDPFCVITPEIMSHRFFGRSVAELVQDLQLIKSTIWRQMLDNLYLANNPVTEVVDNQVNLDDLMTRRPGGIVRVKGAGAMREVATPFVAKESFPMLEYIDAVRENRTGVTRYNQGLDADSLNKTAHGINQIITAGQQRIRLIARVFAETGFKDVARKTLGLSVKHQSEQRMIRLRGRFVPMDPRDWQGQYDATISVGLGTGDRTSLANQLMILLSTVDAKIVELQGGLNGPLLRPENVYAKLKRMVEYMGLKSVEQYYSDPSEPQPPPPPPPPNPLLIDAQAKAQKVQVDAQKAERDAAIAERELQLKFLDLQARRGDEAEKRRLEIQKAEIQREIELLKLAQAQANAQATMQRGDLQMVLDAAKHDMAREDAQAQRDFAEEMDVSRFNMERMGQAEERAMKRMGMGLSDDGGAEQALGAALKQMTEVLARMEKVQTENSALARKLLEEND